MIETPQPDFCPGNAVLLLSSFTRLFWCVLHVSVEFLARLGRFDENLVFHIQTIAGHVHTLEE
jgi:hypothetical protein